HREDLLGAVLPDHVVVEEGLDLHRGGQRHGRAVLLALALLGDDVVAELDALVADVDGGAGDQLADLALPLPAEGAAEISVVAVLPAHADSSGFQFMRAYGKWAPFSTVQRCRIFRDASPSSSGDCRRS